MKIYTKTGDRGETSLVGGARVPKSHPRINATGTIEELIAHLGILIDMLEEQEQKNQLVIIQNTLMQCCTLVSFDHDTQPCPFNLKTNYLEELENWIDHIEDQLPLARGFILPSGHLSYSTCHIARTVCRRAERECIKLSEGMIIPEIILIYLNRLSDYLFVLSRLTAFRLDLSEILWNPDFGE